MSAGPAAGCGAVHCRLACLWQACMISGRPPNKAENARRACRPCIVACPQADDQVEHAWGSPPHQQALNAVLAAQDRVHQLEKLHLPDLLARACARKGQLSGGAAEAAQALVWAEQHLLQLGRELLEVSRSFTQDALCVMGEWESGDKELVPASWWLMLQQVRCGSAACALQPALARCRGLRCWQLTAVLLHILL